MALRLRRRTVVPISTQLESDGWDPEKVLTDAPASAEAPVGRSGSRANGEG